LLVSPQLWQDRSDIEKASRRIINAEACKEDRVDGKGSKDAKTEGPHRPRDTERGKGKRARDERGRQIAYGSDQPNVEKTAANESEDKNARPVFAGCLILPPVRKRFSRDQKPERHQDDRCCLRENLRPAKNAWFGLNAERSPQKEETGSKSRRCGKEVAECERPDHVTCPANGVVQFIAAAIGDHFS